MAGRRTGKVTAKNGLGGAVTVAVGVDVTSLKAVAVLVDTVRDQFGCAGADIAVRVVTVWAETSVADAVTVVVGIGAGAEGGRRRRCRGGRRVTGKENVGSKIGVANSK